MLKYVKDRYTVQLAMKTLEIVEVVAENIPDVVKDKNKYLLGIYVTASRWKLGHRPSFCYYMNLI